MNEFIQEFELKIHILNCHGSLKSLTENINDLFSIRQLATAARQVKNISLKVIGTFVIEKVVDELDFSSIQPFNPDYVKF